MADPARRLLRDDLAIIFKESLREVVVSEDTVPVRHWGGSFNVRSHTMINIYGEVCLDWMNETEENLLRIYQGWMKERLKVDIGPFKGVTPVSFDMVYSAETFGRRLRTHFMCDYLEEDYVDFLPNVSHDSRRDRVMNHEFGQKKNKKKEDHFEKDLFKV